MNPIEKLISEHLAEGDTVVSVYADRKSLGIVIRHLDFTESPHEIPGGDYAQNQRWVEEAISKRLQGMTPLERRTALVRLLAEMDQRIAEAEDLSETSLLAIDERSFVAEQIAFRRNAAMRIEGLLAELEP